VDGRRVVVVPVLTCAPRGIEPPCAPCAAGHLNLCERVAFGHLEPGLQCGFCESTGGGWSQEMIVHESQVVDVADELSDRQAVMIEPTACAVHAAHQVDVGRVAVIGAGTLGLLTIAALRRLSPATEIIATAKHPEQKRWAKELGADVTCAPGELARAVRSTTGSMVIGHQLTGGVPAVVDCVGSEATLGQALQVVAPGGTLHVVGMPAQTTLDLTALWHRETILRGCYAYERGDFETAAELVASSALDRLLSATYPLARYEDAIDHAANADARGAVKIAFDLRVERR
jgi:threonine dehydrogenase-like Zn-dependent dehydrogenase